ncbi:MAG: SDR family oxidoreductase [Polyangiales bacterium]
MQNIVITGANRGIGWELTRQYVARGDHVVAACREVSRDLHTLAQQHPGQVRIHSGLDVTNAAAIDAFRGTLVPHSVHTLINNAGILRSTSLRPLDFEALRQQYEINALGPLRLTAELLDAFVPAGAKVGLVSSRMGSIADNSSGGTYGYRMSKAALNAAGKSLAHDLKGRGVAVAILHPGYVRTDMTGGRGDVTAAQAAQGLIARLDALSLENTGRFWHASGEELPW